MEKTNFLIVLFIVILSSCSREENKTDNAKQQNSSDYIHQVVKVPTKIGNQKLQKEFFDLQVENAIDRVKEKTIYDFAQDVYLSVDSEYITYIEGPDVDYQKYNKNGKYLVFPFNDNGFIDGNKYITIFKYNNKIYVFGDLGDCYIDTKKMYFFSSLDDKQAKEKIESIPIEYRCKISIQNDNKIKFYDKNCETRIKEMLKITSTNKDKS